MKALGSRCENGRLQSKGKTNMIMWYKTKRINRYTGQPNRVAMYKHIQLIVYKRAYGWSYTSRFLIEGRWLQCAASSNDFWYYMGEAQLQAPLAADFLIGKLGPLIDPQPPRPSKATDDPPEPPEALPTSIGFRRRL